MAAPIIFFTALALGVAACSSSSNEEKDTSTKPKDAGSTPDGSVSETSPYDSSRNIDSAAESGVGPELDAYVELPSEDADADVSADIDAPDIKVDTEPDVHETNPDISEVEIEPDIPMPEVEVDSGPDITVPEVDAGPDVTISEIDAGSYDADAIDAYEAGVGDIGPDIPMPEVEVDAAFDFAAPEIDATEVKIEPDTAPDTGPTLPKGISKIVEGVCDNYKDIDIGKNDVMTGICGAGFNAGKMFSGQNFSIGGGIDLNKVKAAKNCTAEAVQIQEISAGKYIAPWACAEDSNVTGISFLYPDGKATTDIFNSTLMMGADFKGVQSCVVAKIVEDQKPVDRLFCGAAMYSAVAQKSGIFGVGMKKDLLDYAAKEFPIFLQGEFLSSLTPLTPDNKLVAALNSKGKSGATIDKVDPTSNDKSKAVKKTIALGENIYPLPELALAANYSFAAVPALSGKLFIVDMKADKLAGSLVTTGVINDTAVIGATVYVLTNENVFIVDATNFASPNLTQTINFGGEKLAVNSSGIVYVAKGGTIYSIDPALAGK